MSELTLIIGNQTYSSWSLRPWCYLVQNGLPCVVQKHHLDDPDLEGLLSNFDCDGKVPVLIDDGRIIWDSLAILEYLVERFPSTQGWPTDPDRRALARSVSAEMHSSFQDLRCELPMNTRRKPTPVTLSPAAITDVERIRHLWQRCRLFADGGDWLLGRFGVVDAMFAPVALRFHHYTIPLDPVCATYVQTVLNSPALRRWYVEAAAEVWIRPQFEL